MFDENVKEAYRKFLYGALMGCLIFLVGKLKAHIPHQCNPGGERDSGALLCSNCVGEYIREAVTLRRRRLFAMFLMACSMMFGGYTLFLMYRHGNVDYSYLRLNCLFFILAVYSSYDYNLILPYLDYYFLFCVASVLFMPVASHYNISMDVVSGSMIISSFLLMIMGHLRRIYHVPPQQQ